jgi:hypothetical protein
LNGSKTWRRTQKRTDACSRFEFSQTIIDCFLKATQKLGIQCYRTKCNLFSKENEWKIETQTENYLVWKVNSSYRKQSPKVWEMLQNFTRC